MRFLLRCEMLEVMDEHVSSDGVEDGQLVLGRVIDDHPAPVAERQAHPVEDLSVVTDQREALRDLAAGLTDTARAEVEVEPRLRAQAEDVVSYGTLVAPGEERAELCETGIACSIPEELRRRAAFDRLVELLIRNDCGHVSDPVFVCLCTKNNGGVAHRQPLHVDF